MEYIMQLIYPISIFIMWKMLSHHVIKKRDCYKHDIDILHLVRIAVGHTILLIIAIMGFMLANRVAFSWYVVFEIYGSVLAEQIHEAVRRLRFLIIVTIFIVIESFKDYRRLRPENLSVTIHSLGLMCTLVCYINVLTSNQDLNHYSDRIMICEMVYLESIILVGIFLFYCYKLRRNIENT